MEDAQRPFRLSGPPRPLEGPPRRTPATWRWWEGVAVFALALILGSFVAGAVGLALPRGNWRELVAGLVVQATLAGAVVVWLRTFHRDALPALGFPTRPRADVLVGLAAGVGLFLVAIFVIAPALVALIDSVAGRRPPAPEQIPEALTGAQTALLWVMVIVAAPVSEELFFRGALFRALRERHGFAFAGAASALAFGASHIQDRLLAYALLASVMFFVGLGLAFVYERRRSLLAAVAAHAGFNVVGLLLLLYLE